MLETIIGLSVAGLFILATIGVMRNRSTTREIGKEAEQLNILSNDTRFAFWRASADEGPGHDSGGDSGGGDGGGGGD